MLLYALTAFPARPHRQADCHELFLPYWVRSDIDFYVDQIGFDAIDGGGERGKEHGRRGV